tara:strand:+ start:715 stop:957 length:243 start_codon:yes stop_codon:yes gene_type:complete
MDSNNKKKIKIKNKSMIGLPPSTIELNKEDNENIEKYIKSLDEREMIALKIAEEDLGTSFDIEKSIGYIEYLNKISKDNI